MRDLSDLEALEAMLAASAPPQTCDAVLEAVDGLGARLAGLDRLSTLAVLAGLQTDPAFGANTVRLDMAMRLTLACAAGETRPTRDKLFRLLNRDLVDCGVNRLEDPPEDFFANVVATRRGPYRVFQGVWEKAAAFTEDLFEAFGKLPPSPSGAHAFDRAHALLTLSDLIAFRSGLSGRTPATERSTEKLALPNNRQLRDIGGRCLLSWPSLARLDIDAELLAPFLMDDSVDSDFASLEPGESDLERRPLLGFAEGVIVVAPHNLSTAARAHLIETAVAGGAGERLLYGLLDAQSERVSIAGFAMLSNAPTMEVEGNPIRQTIWQRTPGRPIHLLQIVDGFSGGPARFGMADEPHALDRIVEQSIGYARDAMRARPDFREGLSIVFLGGWGRAGSTALPPADPDWDVIAIEPEDAAAIGMVEGGKPMDLWRLSKQMRMIAAQGYRLEGANGWLNLFALWRETSGTLIPEHHIDFQPPAIFTFPTDLVLYVREDAACRQGRNALPLANGRYDVVVRLDREDFFDSAKPSYCSIDAIRRGEMLGVVVGRRPVWLRVMPAQDSDRAFDTHETWRAAIHWLEVGLPAFDAAYPDLDTAPVFIDLTMDWPPDRLGNPVDDAAIEAAISMSLDAAARSAALHLSPSWQHGLHRADNHAELCLAAAMLTIVSALAGGDADRAALYTLMRDVVGSDDIRWRHSFAADRPLTLLKAHGLIGRFDEIPQSASALARCGSTFLSRQRAAGPRIEGADDCFAFLMTQHRALFERLLGSVRGFDRVGLVMASVGRLVSALAEEQTWTMSARALRAIYGAERDRERSLHRRSQINAVIRGASILSEVAASEAPLEGGRAAGEADLDELLAQCLLLFQTAELVPPIRGGFMDPKFEISPTGDLLYDHSFTRTALAPSVHLRHAEQRASADASYRTHFETDGDAAPLDAAFKAAVAVEYAMPFDAFVALSGACTELAVASGSAVLRLRRSELIAAIAVLPGYGDIDLDPAFDRLTLAARDGWASLPLGAAASDFDISRFDRHHSLITRPIIALSRDEDPWLLISPPLMERAALHNLGGAMQGGLQGKFWASADMRKYVGSIAEKTGLDFNLRVTEAVRQLGLTAYNSVKLSDALHHKGTEAVKRLGDIDVLAFTADGRHAWVGEAKDIRFCRTLGETTSRLSEFRGLTDGRGRRDNLRKHLDRVAYVRKHAGDLAKRYGLAAAPAVHGLVVFDSPQPMAFVPSHASADARFVMLSELAEVDWSAP